MVVSPFLISLEISSISLAGGIGHGDVGSAGSGSLYAPIVIKADGPLKDRPHVTDERCACRGLNRAYFEYMDR